MELVTKQNIEGANYLIFQKGKEKPDEQLITIHSCLFPDNVDPERTCRMIQSMEDGFKIIKAEKKSIEDLEKANIYPEEISHTNNRDDEYKRMASFVDFIEHEDKEEATLSVSFADPYYPYCLKTISILKSKAIEAGIIKE